MSDLDIKRLLEEIVALREEVAALRREIRAMARSPFELPTMPPILLENCDPWPPFEVTCGHRH